MHKVPLNSYLRRTGYIHNTGHLVTIKLNDGIFNFNSFVSDGGLGEGSSPAGDALP